MSAVLRMPSNDQRLHPLRNTLDKYSTPAFTATNKGSSPSLHSLTRLECGKAWERVPSAPSIHPVSSSTDLTTAAGDKPHGFPSKRKRSHSTQTTHLCQSLARRAMPAAPSLMASLENRTASKSYHRVLPTAEVSYSEHRPSVDPQDCEADQGHKLSTLELPYKNALLVPESSPSDHTKSTSDDTGAIQRFDHIRVVKSRQFVSRSRTGCRTCRKRKKKCDEAKPTCRNCVRGNFECAGYPKDVPLSRNHPAHISPAPRPQQQMCSTEVPAHIVRCSVCNVTHSPQCGPSQKVYAKPIAASRLTISRDGPVCTDKQGCKPLTPSLWYLTCIDESQHDAHQPLAPLRSRSASAGLHAPQNVSQTVSRLQTARTQSTKYAQLKPPAPSDEARPNDDHHATYSLPSTALAPAARQAPSSSHYAQPCLPPKSEKDRMLSGKPFLPDTAQLDGERDLCSQALFRFNTAEPNVSPYRGWFFERIVAAGWIYPRVGERQVTGRLGRGVIVSAPFHCDYGYNLSIGDNAVIGSDCQMLDSGRIVIGKNTRIGARVSISTLKEPTDARPIEGNERTGAAREVSIGKNVYIGDGCIIKAGVRIGDDAIVRAGSVVLQGIPANCLASGNPARAQTIDWEG